MNSFSKFTEISIGRNDFIDLKIVKKEIVVQKAT